MTDYNDSNEDEWLQNLILNGAVEISGIDSTSGEFLYSFTDKLEQVDPKLYDKAISSLYNDARLLWMEGYIEMDITQSNPKIALNRKALIREEVEKLSPALQSTLGYIVTALLND